MWQSYRDFAKTERDRAGHRQSVWGCSSRQPRGGCPAGTTHGQIVSLSSTKRSYELRRSSPAKEAWMIASNLFQTQPHPQFWSWDLGLKPLAAPPVCQPRVTPQAHHAHRLAPKQEYPSTLSSVKRKTNLICVAKQTQDCCRTIHSLKC